jgi:hypothetical protein
LVAAFGYKEIRKAVWDCNCFKSWVSWMVWTLISLKNFGTISERWSLEFISWVS